MIHSTPAHKSLPIVMATSITLAIFSGPTSSSPNLTSYDEPGSRSDCYIKVDDPHISNYYLKRGEVRVKVNARSYCALGHSQVKLSIEIWKKGRIGSNFVKKFETLPNAKISSGIKVELKNASVICLNEKATSYFAYAYSKALVHGKKRRTPVAVSDTVNLKCGT